MSGCVSGAGQRAGIDRLLTMDLHAGQVQGFFEKTVDHMTAMPLLTQYVKDQLGDESDLVIISPDAGRVKLTTLSDKQANYIGVSQDGPFKPDHYRY